MTKEDALRLWKNDRVLFNCGRLGYLEGIILEISPSREFFKLQYSTPIDREEWFAVSKIVERLPYQFVPFVPQKRRWWGCS